MNKYIATYRDKRSLVPAYNAYSAQVSVAKKWHCRWIDVKVELCTEAEQSIWIDEEPALL